MSDDTNPGSSAPIGGQRPPARRGTGETAVRIGAEALFSRVAIVEGERGDDLAAELAGEGISARVIPRTVLARLTSGFAIIEARSGSNDLAAPLLALRRHQAQVGVLALGDLAVPDITALLRDSAHAVLPLGATASMIAAQLRALARLMVMELISEQPDIINVQNISIDLQRMEVRAGGQLIALTPTEFRILAQLARRPGQVISHVEIFNEVHGYSVSDNEAKNILKVHIWRLRSKLTEAAAGPSPIVNVRGFGYMLERRASRERRARLAEAGER